MGKGGGGWKMPLRIVMSSSLGPVNVPLLEQETLQT